MRVVGWAVTCAEWNHRWSRPEAYERGGDEFIRRRDEDTHGDTGGPALQYLSRDVQTRHACSCNSASASWDSLWLPVGTRKTRLVDLLLLSVGLPRASAHSCSLLRQQRLPHLFSTNWGHWGGREWGSPHRKQNLLGYPQNDLVLPLPLSLSLSLTPSPV